MFTQASFTKCLQAAQTVFAVICLTCSTSILAEQAGLNPISHYIIGGKAVPPWTMTLGDEENWYVPLTEPEGNSKTKKIQVSPTNYEGKKDAIQITWTGKSGPGSFSLTGNTIDLSSVENDVALVLNMRVDSKMKGGIAIAMDCDWPCRGSLALKPFVEPYKKKEWFTLALPLSCFSKTGADLSKISGPLHLQSEGRAKISIANARLVVLPKNAPNICAGEGE